jgi:LmbE family N-acetylglucosaminyl deacetylase
MLKFLPSMLVASSLYLANILREEPESWTEQLVHHTGYITGDLEACVAELRALIRDVPRETVLLFSLPTPPPPSHCRCNASLIPCTCMAGLGL